MKSWRGNHQRFRNLGARLASLFARDLLSLFRTIHSKYDSKKGAKNWSSLASRISQNYPELVQALLNYSWFLENDEVNQKYVELVCCLVSSNPSNNRSFIQKMVECFLPAFDEEQRTLFSSLP